MDIDVPSTVEVFTTLRYINVHLLTYLLTPQEAAAAVPAATAAADAPSYSQFSD